MSFFKKILNKIFPEPRKLYDEYFGEMNDNHGYFECNVFFKPINKKIEIGISGNENGPFKEARLFYKEVEANYEEIVKAVSPIILENFSDWNPSVKIENFKTEFEPVYLFIPTSKGNDWEIAFETIHDHHLFTVTMNNYTPKHVNIEG